MKKYEETFEAILGPVRSPPLDEDEIFHETPPPEDGEPTLREAVEEWVRVAPECVVVFPTYVSDLVLRNLSLAEQAVLLRMLRLSGGIGRATDRTRPREIAKACGLRPSLAGAVIRSLAEKGLVAQTRRKSERRHLTPPSRPEP